jgi:hypothetical protein
VRAVLAPAVRLRHLLENGRRIARRLADAPRKRTRQAGNLERNLQGK